MIFRVGADDNGVDQDARHMNRLQVVMAIDQPLHLCDDDPTRIMRGLCNRQQFMVKGFLMRTEVAVGIGAGGANQRTVNWKRRIEQIIFAAEMDRFDPYRLAGLTGGAIGSKRPGIDGAALKTRVELGTRVDEGLQTDFCQNARFATGNRAVEMRHDALRQVESFAVAIKRKAAEARRGTPVTTDNAPGHSGVAEMIDAARSPVALTGRIYQRQITRHAGCEEPFFQRPRDRFGMSGAHEAGTGNRPAGFDQGSRLRLGEDVHDGFRCNSSASQRAADWQAAESAPDAMAANAPVKS